MTLLSLSAFETGQAAGSGNHWDQTGQGLWPGALRGDGGG